MFNPYAPPANYQAPTPPTRPKIDLNTGIQTGVGAIDLIGSSIAMGNESLNLGHAPGEQVSSTGEPIYNLGRFYNRVAGSKPQGASGGEVVGGAAKGAAAGAAFGPWGAAAGAVVGTVGSLIGGRRRKRKQSEQRRKAMNEAKAAQGNYNESSLQFEQEQVARTEYNKRRNMNNRLYNLYNTPQTTGY